ncbi:MAG: type I glyceraldehyde-3-phosphate dehydrogenase [Chlamydiales bacterium]
MRIAINGLGRIGRHVLKRALKYPHITVVAVNDLVPLDNLGYLLRFDSTHGCFSGKIEIQEETLLVDNKKILVLNEKDVTALPWKKLNIDYVIEATGLFTGKAMAQQHLQAGAKRVVITAPAKGDVSTFVMGVNHTNYDPDKDRIVSNASCTTNCLAPLAKVLLDHFGIEEGLMTTIHAMTATQSVVDGPSKKDWRGGRGAHQNIIPSSTGAAQAVGLCLPKLKGKFTGMAFRVPIADVSVVDLTIRLTRATSYEAICEKMFEAAQGSMKGILDYCQEEVVSSDFIGSTFSSIFDVKAGIALNDRFFKLIAWYDNEIGYACRVIDLIHYIANQEPKGLM